MFKNSTKNKMSDKSNHHENKIRIRIFELKENSLSNGKQQRKKKFLPRKKTIRTTTTTTKKPRK